MLTLRARWRLLMAVCAIGLVALSPIGASGAAEAPAPSLSVAEAQQAFDSIWPHFEAAFVQGQLGVLQKYSTQDVFQAVSADTGCGCVWDTPHSPVLFSVPPDQHYPLSFLAQLKTAAPPHSIYSPYVTIAVLTKAADDSPWKVAYVMRYAGDHGFLTASTTDAPSQASFPLTWMTPDIARYLTTYAQTGEPPPGAVWIDGGALAYETQQTQTVQAEVASSGDQQQTQFNAVDNSAIFAYQGGDIICGSFMELASVRPEPPNTVIVQSATQSPWGSGLAPGSYSSLSKTGLTLVCFHANTTHARNVIAPISFFGGVYQLTGSP